MRVPSLKEAMEQLEASYGDILEGTEIPSDLENAIIDVLDTWNKGPSE